jgi:hypothetical protein
LKRGPWNTTAAAVDDHLGDERHEGSCQDQARLTRREGKTVHCV